MKTRIFSIMDMGGKKAGLLLLCCALILTLGTGVAFAAGADPRTPPENTNAKFEVLPWIAGSFLPDPDIYAKYADFGITISSDGAKLLYNGQPVRLFADEKSDTEAFYLDGSGALDLSAVRNAAGEITGIESINKQQAQAYQDAFFAEERGEAAPEAQDIAEVLETVQAGPNKYDQYQPFGVTCSGEALYFNGLRVKFLIDRSAGGVADTLWTDDAGTVNLAVLRDASGQITGIESISGTKALEYQSAADDSLDGLEERVEARVNARYQNGD